MATACSLRRSSEYIHVLNVRPQEFNFTARYPVLSLRRRQLLLHCSTSDVPVVARCLRRAWLWGTDEFSGKDSTACSRRRSTSSIPEDLRHPPIYPYITYSYAMVTLAVRDDHAEFKLANMSNMT